MKTRHYLLKSILLLLLFVLLSGRVALTQAQEGAKPAGEAPVGQPLPAANALPPTTNAPQGIEVVSGYTFSDFDGSPYTPIITGTVHGVANNDDTLFPNIPINFTFNYDGTNHTVVGICSNGYIVMGLASGVSCGVYTPISSPTYNNLISALGTDLQGIVGTGELRSQTAGSAPNRVFTVQWRNYRYWNQAGDDFTFQIKLYETSNIIEVVYGSFAKNATPRTPQVGLKGASGADYNNRAGADWSASTAGVANSDTMTLDNSGASPASGWTYRWTPPNFPPTISYTALGNTASTANRAFAGVTIADPDGVNVAPGTAPRVYYKRSTDANEWNDNTSGTDGWKYVEANGATSPFDFTINYALLSGGTGVSAGNIVQYFVVAQDLAGTPAVGVNSGTFAAAPSSVALTAAAFPIGGAVNSYTISFTYAGAYDVPGAFPSLTNNGGIFEALNSGVFTGDVTINITGDLLNESGTHSLNQWAEEGAGNYTLLIKPTGAPRAISGTGAGTHVIRLNGADRVTIDGSLNGGADRSLTIQNPNLTANTAVIWLASPSAANGATDNTIKNSVIRGSGSYATAVGVFSGSTAIGAAAIAPNSNNTIQNNEIKQVQNAAFINGGAVNLDQNWLITGNTFGSTTTAEKLGFRGMFIGGSQNFTISDNVIHGVVSSASSTATMTGIQVGSVINGGAIVRNRISDIKQTNTAGWGSNGIYLAASSTASNLLVANNMIYDVASYGFNSVNQADNGYGIMVNSGGGYALYYNSVNLTTNQTNVNGITAAINIAGAVTTAGSLDIRNNIFANSQTVGTRYAIYSAAANTVFANINYNNYYPGTGILGFLGGARADIPAWQTATGQDANSISGDPLFVSTTDLHIFGATSPVANAGTPIAGVTTDFDGQTRDAATPDIGADEGVTVVCPLSGTYNYDVWTTDNPCVVTADTTINGHLNAANALTVNSGVTLNVGPNNVNVGGVLTNNGRLQQSKNVSGAGFAGFFNTGGYGGVLIDPGSSLPLGATTVTINKISGDSCALGGELTATRCFTISPANNAGRNATVRFYFDESADLPLGLACADLLVYHYDGGGVWSLAGGTGGAPTCAGPNSYVEVSGVTDFSAFALGGAVTPTAVALRNAGASATSLALVLSLVVVGLAALTTVHLARRRAR